MRCGRFALVPEFTFSKKTPSALHSNFTLYDYRKFARSLFSVRPPCHKSGGQWMGCGFLLLPIEERTLYNANLFSQQRPPYVLSKLVSQFPAENDCDLVPPHRCEVSQV